MCCVHGGIGCPCCVHVGMGINNWWFTHFSVHAQNKCDLCHFHLHGWNLPSWSTLPIAGLRDWNGYDLFVPKMESLLIVIQSGNIIYYTIQYKRIRKYAVADGRTYSTCIVLIIKYCICSFVLRLLLARFQIIIMICPAAEN